MNNLSTEEKEKFVFDEKELCLAVDALSENFTAPTKTFLSRFEEGSLTEEEFIQEMNSFLKLFFSGKPVTSEERREVCERFLQQLKGYGKIDSLLNDDTISDIKIISHKNIRIKRNGQREDANMEFTSKEDYDRFVNLLAAKNKINLGLKNSLKVFSDKKTNDRARLRFNITTGFINSNEQTLIQIRKVLKKKRSLESLVLLDVITKEQQKYLEEKIESARGIIFTGKGASGKTTLMNACLAKIPRDKSGLVIQESEELFDEDHPELIFQHIVSNSGEGSVSYSLKDLATNGLLIDLDYFIIGEIKGGEAAYFLNASYTGHQCWASVHGVNSTEALNKLCDYVTYDTNYSVKEIMKMLRFMEVIIYMKDFKVAEISEICGFDDVEGKPIYKKVFEGKQRISE